MGRLFRDLRLNFKVTGTLTVTFVTIAAAFLLILSYFQGVQRQRGLELKRNLLTTLQDNFSRRFVYSIFGEDETSLALDLATLASREGVLGAWVTVPSMNLVATSDSLKIREVVKNAIEESSGRESNPDDDVVLVREDGGELRVFQANGRSRVISVASVPDLLPGFREREETTDPFVEVSWEGRIAYSYRADIKTRDGTLGNLHVLFTLDDLAKGERITRTMFYGLILAIFVFLLVLLNLLISRIVIRPVSRVMHAMRKASKGDLQVELEVESRDELGTMADSFNSMVRDLKVSKDKIEDHNLELERRVADRTHELRESEEMLLNLKNHLSTVIANVETGVISLDASGVISTFNDRAGRILVIADEKAEGKKLDAVLVGPERRRLLEFLSPVLSGKVTESRGQLVLRLPGGRRTLAVVASTLFGESRGARKERACIGWVVVFDDLTQLISSQRLEAWKEAVEKVIHEIKNPLTPISLAAQKIRSSYYDDKENFEEIFLWGSKTILDSVISLKDLITEFSRFYRLPKVVLRTQEVNRLVEDTLSLYDQRDAPNVVVERNLAGDLPSIEADAEQLKRVLLNIVKNGIESHEGNDGRVLVSTQGLDDRGMIKISIRDEGAGIEDVEKIFEPYYTTKVKGTGLGLIISRQIVEEHGGEIEVRSEVGSGTEVDILLPPSRGRSERGEEPIS